MPRCNVTPPNLETLVVWLEGLEPSKHAEKKVEELRLTYDLYRRPQRMSR
mgnify:CR=1 FL=1